MSGIEGFGDKVAFIWSVADLLRGSVRQHEYGQFILPTAFLDKSEFRDALTRMIGNEFYKTIRESGATG